MPDVPRHLRYAREVFVSSFQRLKTRSLFIRGRLRRAPDRGWSSAAHLPWQDQNERVRAVDHDPAETGARAHAVSRIFMNEDLSSEEVKILAETVAEVALISRRLIEETQALEVSEQANGRRMTHLQVIDHVAGPY